MRVRNDASKGLDHETYPVFWKWSDAAVDHGMLRGHLHAVFGWTVRVGKDANPRALRNFPMQSNGAEMLRLACCLATECGIAVCAPVHDALLIEGPSDSIYEVVAEQQCTVKRRKSCSTGSRSVHGREDRHVARPVYGQARSRDAAPGDGAADRPGLLLPRRRQDACLAACLTSPARRRRETPRRRCHPRLILYLISLLRDILWPPCRTPTNCGCQPRRRDRFDRQNGRRDTDRTSGFFRGPCRGRGWTARAACLARCGGRFRALAPCWYGQEADRASLSSAVTELGLNEDSIRDAESPD